MKNIFYILNIIYTLVIGGFMTMYCITLGRYFSYIAKENMIKGFTDYYGVFRKNTNVKLIFFIFLIGQFIISVISLILNLNRPIIFQLFSLLCVFVILILHTLTNFLKSEEALNSGNNISNEVLNNYIKYNIPLHIFYAIYYIFSGGILLFNM